MTVAGKQAALAGVSSRASLPSTAELYRFSLGLGLRALRQRRFHAALPRLMNPMSYPRGMEFRLALQEMALSGRERVLDVASPKLLFVWLAANTRLDLAATDILESFIAPTRDLLESLGLGEEIGGRLRLERQDARSLAYADGSFDVAYSISVLEHIPGDGDGQAMREIARVLRPGGRVCLTVPFASRYEEDWVRRDVFERRRLGNQKVFYQRRYDDETLARRLIAPSGLREDGRRYFGEPGIRLDRYWNRVPLPLRSGLAWLQPLFERAFLRELDRGRHERAVGVALTLVKERHAVDR
ncbi:MAG: methyltransferase domain-containing protein [Dehalococcoidia bacterium]|jgi:SAM-dependent methyltransferase